MKNTNKLIWDKIAEMVGCNCSMESPLSQLPLSPYFLRRVEDEFSMTVRGREWKIFLSDDMWHLTLRDLVHAVDREYQHNYFNSEQGTSTTGVVGVVKDAEGKPLVSKWNLRGDALVTRLKEMQALNPGLTILDMGCGVNAYKAHLNNVTGVDPYRPEADITSLQEDFNPNGEQKWDVIICFGPQNWYTYDQQYRNFQALKRSLAPNGLILWSHVHNYYHTLATDGIHSHTWLHGKHEDGHRNSSFLLNDREWKYVWYFNWTEFSLSTVVDHVGLKVQQFDYDHCNLYRPPMWRMFVEITHE